MALSRQMQTEYDTVYSGCGFYQYTEPAIVRVSGEDRIDFLQRQTTNNLDLLEIGRALPNVLTSASARIIEAFIMLQEDDHIALIGEDRHGEHLANYLSSKIFFMDKVDVANVSAEQSQMVVQGSNAKELLATVGLHELLTYDHVAGGELGEAQVLLFKQRNELLDTFHVLAPIEYKSRLTELFISAGAIEMSTETYHILRVEAGIPAAPSELNEEYTPLEVNLEHAVSSSKGCYTGQEVIARQITYDKVVKKLVGLSLDTLQPTGSRIEIDGKNVGVLTSVAESPRSGPIALAVIKRPHNKRGTVVNIVAGQDLHSAQVVDLPFS